MSYHFINLVSWKFFKKRDVNIFLFVDSISLWLLCLIFGKKTFRNSGYRVFHSLSNFDSTLFLVSDLKKSNSNQIQLPFWRTENDIVLEEKLVNEIQKYDRIIIGISSPKQDYLAFLISLKFPSKEIYCLGAAIYTSSNLRNFDKLGFTWFGLMLKDFKRFRSKMYKTLISIFLILFHSKTRKEFREFVKLVE